MKILGIETSGRICAVAVVDGQRTLARAVSDEPGKHVEKAVGMIADLLRETSIGLEELDGVAVSLGPGSFTGLRIGLGTAEGLCFGTGLPLAGVPTLDCMAETLCPWDGHIVPLRDARRGEIYFASYRSEGCRVERLSPYQALSPDRVVEEIDLLADGTRTLVAGDALERYGDILKPRLAGRVEFAPEERWVVDPAAVARLGARMIGAGRTLDLRGSEPLYLRPSEAERGLGRIDGDGAPSH